MSNLVDRAIAPAGYVRSCFSRRARAHCLPLELVRRHLGAVNRGGLRRRLAREFGGYLVTEPDVLPVWRIGGRVVLLFADPALRRVVGLLDEGDEIFAMDAPAFMPAGSARRYAPAGSISACAEQWRIHRDWWAS